MTNKQALMEALAREAYEKGAFTGTWLYAENGRIVSKGAVGFCDPEDKLPMREDCLFDLASVSKQFTAAAVMLLRRRGLLSLDDEVTRFFPAIPYKGVTVRHLLSHTGGLPDYMDWFDALWKRDKKIPDNAVIVRFLCECGEPAVFAPGEQWEYSNTGYCLLAQIVEEVSGVPFEDFMRDNLFEPAGMHATRIYHRRMDSLTVPNLACGLVLPLGADRYALPDGEAAESCVLSCDGVSGDGLVHSNIFDLLAWDRTLRAETVLTREEQELMYTPATLNNGETAQTGEESDEGYGFGWCIARDPALGRIVRHDGGWPGYSTWFERWLDADRVLILLRCRDARDERAYAAFDRGIKAIARDEAPAPVRTIEELAVHDPDRSGWEAYCGKYDYAIGDFSIEEIVMKAGELYARVSYRGVPGELRMYPLGEATFGIKDIDGDITFGSGCLTMYDQTGNKL